MRFFRKEKKEQGQMEPQSAPVVPKVDLYAMVRRGATETANDIRTPADNWNQVLFAQTADGRTAVCPLPDQEAFAEGSFNRKTFEESVLPLFCETIKPDRIVLMLNCTWEIGIQDNVETFAEGVTALYIREFTAEGLQRAEVAVIGKDERGLRTLGEWEQWTHEHGELHDTCVAALRGELSSGFPPEMVEQMQAQIGSGSLFPTFPAPPK